jgi:RNA polymerase sigma-70 factor (ECF subfamily)
VIDLVRRAQAGDDGAFEALYRQHVGRVYALCLRLAGDRVHAEELVQDVFVRAWDRLRSFRGDSAFSSWLHRLAVNVVIERRRTFAIQRERLAPDPAVLDTLPIAPARADLTVDFEHAIEQLPPGAREVFVLHDVEGYKHREIAVMLGVATGTSKRQLHRARMLMRRHLEAR